MTLSTTRATGITTLISEIARSRQLIPSAAIMLVVSDIATQVQPGFRLHTSRKPELLFAMMRIFASEGATISFEGQLSNTELAKIAGASFSETQVLRRNTTWPRMDFLILPLTSTIATAIEKAVVSKVAFNGNRGIIHVQIEKHGHLVFVACDQFHQDCVWVSSNVPASVLADLVEKRVLLSFKPA